jgi:uncharacterized membrane protein YphA (DoxX/SURF4 family)
MKRSQLHSAARIIIAGVWIFHGLWSKILGGIPRHEMIVAKILGAEFARPLTVLIGCGEILLGLWVLSGRRPLACAAFQTLILVSMNALEIRLANELLISAPGMVALNLLLLATVWWLAVDKGSSRKA